MSNFIRLQIQEMVQESVKEWKETNTLDQMREEVKNTLDQARKETILKILGFRRDGWNNRLEIDHCNGRHGNSLIGDYIREKANETVKEWVEEMIPEIKKIKMTESQKNSILKDCTTIVEKAVKSHLNRELEKRGERIAEEYLALLDQAVDKFE